MNGPWVLMYHRVCEREANTRCWFERGTAITPAALDRQLGWLLARFAVVPLEDLHAPRGPGDRPRVALTFDDGYADTLEIAAPICAHHGVVATCFASAGPARRGPGLWFDTWYALVHTGVGQRGWHATLTTLGVPEAADLAACVRGPAKRWLAGLSPDHRQALLERLAHALGVPLPVSRQLDLDGLRQLRRLGWRVGGHGFHHQRLADCDDPSLLLELQGSRQILADVGAPGPWLFAYPDGSWDGRIARAVSIAGFEIACTVHGAPWTAPDERLTVPRLFCRGDGQVAHPLLEGE